MKRIVLTAALAISAFSFSAMAKEAKVKRGITVPFEFKVQNEQLPAGQYRIRNEGANYITLENLETRQRVHVFREGGPDARQYKLKFKNKDGEMVLERVG